MIEFAGLFAAAFLSATLLPGSSEAAFLAVLAYGGALAPAITVATFGNTQGSGANWAIGRWAAHYRDHPRFPVKPATFDRYQRWYARYGVWSLLLSWTPIIGDPLTVMAGIARTPFWLFMLVVSVAKLARYAALAGAFALLW